MSTVEDPAAEAPADKKPIRLRQAKAPVEAIDLRRAAQIISSGCGEGRLATLFALEDGPKSVGELVELTGRSQTAMSQQLPMLRASALVVSTRDGKSVVNELGPLGRTLIKAVRQLLA